MAVGQSLRLEQPLPAASRHTRLQRQFPPVLRRRAQGVHFGVSVRSLDGAASVDRRLHPSAGQGLWLHKPLQLPVAPYAHRSPSRIVLAGNEESNLLRVSPRVETPPTFSAGLRVGFSPDFTFSPAAGTLRGGPDFPVSARPRRPQEGSRRPRCRSEHTVPHGILSPRPARRQAHCWCCLPDSGSPSPVNFCRGGSQKEGEPDKD